MMATLLTIFFLGFNESGETYMLGVWGCGNGARKMVSFLGL
jgi:hypothetical protein